MKYLFAISWALAWNALVDTDIGIVAFMTVASFDLVNWTANKYADRHWADDEAAERDPGAR